MSPTLLASVLLTAAVGILVVTANPRRLTNQAFGLVCLSATVWLTLILLHGRIADPLTTTRLNAAVACIFPWNMWLLKSAIIQPRTPKRLVFQASLPWLSLCLLLVPFCFTISFVEVDLITETTRRGIAYDIHSISLGILYSLVVLHSARDARMQTGVRRLEIQFVVLSIGVGALICLALVVVGNYLALDTLKRLGIIAIGVFFSLTAWSITFHRIFDIGQVLRSIAHRLGLVAVLTTGIIVSLPFLETVLPSPADLAITVTLWSAITIWIDSKSATWLGADARNLLTAARREIIDLARRAPKTDRLVLELEELLRAHCQTDLAVLMFSSGTNYESRNLIFSNNKPGYTALCEIGWITPETLQRRRSSPALDDLRDFLTQHSLGLIITVPRGSPSPELLVAFGQKTNEAPYTYPEVERLQNVAELMDNILIRARLNAQADLQARMEHLTMMSRGLAHDLKNLVTPLSAFLIHTDGEFAPGSAEAEVHLAARRALRVIGEYIREAVFFAEKMRPRFASVDVSSLLAAVQSVASTRAQSHGVVIEISCSVTQPIIADSVLIQRLLGNLVHNAIDASTAGQRVRLSASLLSDDHVRFEVSDHGTGISPENLSRVFDPHFTTKVFGDDDRGFGLGLTICQTITELHRGRIDLQSEKGAGTSVAVILPTFQETTDVPDCVPAVAPFPALSAAGI